MIVPFDIEANGFLKEVTKIHCLSINWNGTIKSTNDYDSMRKLLAMENITLVGHNAVCYDIPTLEKVLGVKVKCKVIDTLPISWYLHSNLPSHGLEFWGGEFGYPKVEVADDEWLNMSYERAVERCERDVEIQTKLWDRLYNELMVLYGDDSFMTSLCPYLSFKMSIVRMQEENPFRLDMDILYRNLEYLEGIRDEKIEALKKVMPTVGVRSKRNPPKNPYKKDGTLSSQGLKWKKLTEERGLPFEYNETIEVIKDYVEPNPQSPQQIKDWLFSLGWKPKFFNEGENGKVPTYLTPDKSICESVLKLGESVKHLDDLGVIKHRIGLLKGFLRDREGEYIHQSIAGFTSTLRLRHKNIVNLPKPSVPYGKLVRGVLSCDDGYEICGSDLASLEDRTKQHFIYPLDPEYVKSMQVEGFDPHLDLAVFAGVLSEQDAQDHKDKKVDHSKVRHQYKTVNYAATYGIGAAKLSQTLEIKQGEAKSIIDAYWERNWAIKAFAKSCATKDAVGKTWVRNPINRFWYELRSEKDIFSAVNQSTGAYIFDLWVGFTLKKVKRITLQMHDEQAIIVKKGYRPQIEKIFKESIEKVNKLLSLNRDMDIDIQWGESYADVH